GNALALRVVADVQEAVQLGVALADRREVRGIQLVARDLTFAQEVVGRFGRQSQRVDHSPPGGTLKKSPSRSGAFASASSAERHARGSSAPHTLTTSSGWDVGGTSVRSSSETFETAAR